MPLDPAEMSRPEKIKAAIQYRARGHAWREIGRRLDTAESNVRRWLSTPEVRRELAQVACEAAPDAEHAATIASDYLLGVVTGEELVTDPETGEAYASAASDRIRSASVLMANHQRMIEVQAKAKEADVAAGQVKTADELMELAVAARERRLADDLTS